MKIMLVIPNHFHPISKTLTWEALISDLLKKHSEYIKLIYRIISKIYKVSIIVQRILKKKSPIHLKFKDNATLSQSNEQ